MKQYEYAIEYVSAGAPYIELRAEPSYEDAMEMVKYLHNNGATEIKILRRSISDWKPIHQSKNFGV